MRKRVLSCCLSVCVWWLGCTNVKSWWSCGTWCDAASPYTPFPAAKIQRAKWTEVGIVTTANCRDVQYHRGFDIRQGFDIAVGLRRAGRGGGSRAKTPSVSTPLRVPPCCVFHHCKSTIKHAECGWRSYPFFVILSTIFSSAHRSSLTNCLWPNDNPPLNPHPSPFHHVHNRRVSPVQSSFFDEISCDALDGRGRMPGGRGGERTRNTETFGATSVALSAGSRRYGGRGGGSYSGYSVSACSSVKR